MTSAEFLQAIYDIASQGGKVSLNNMTVSSFVWGSVGKVELI
jgi:hypothetical protein